MLKELKQSYESLLDVKIAHNEYNHIQIAMIYAIENYQKNVITNYQKYHRSTKIIEKNNNSAMINANKNIIFIYH